MSPMIQDPETGGWYRPRPTHCRLGHRFAPFKVTHGWDGTRPYSFCEHSDHPDEASRWTYETGAQEPAHIPRGTPDHGVR